MTDLFIVFYELGISMLKENGTLGYITPSSYFNSLAGAYMRKYLTQENLLKAVVDLKHFQAFSATTYTTITILKKGKEDRNVDYYRFDERKLRKEKRIGDIEGSVYTMSKLYNRKNKNFQI